MGGVPDKRCERREVKATSEATLWRVIVDRRLLGVTDDDSTEDLSPLPLALLFFPLPFFFSSSCLHTSKLFHYLFCLLFPPLFPGIDFSGDTDGSAITLNASAVICQFALVGTLTLSPLVLGVLPLGLEKSSSSSLFLSSHRTDR